MCAAARFVSILPGPPERTVHASRDPRQPTHQRQGGLTRTCPGAESPSHGTSLGGMDFVGDTDAPIVIAGGGAAGRAAAQALLAAEGQPLPLLHLAGPAGEAIDRTVVDKAIMTGRLTAERAQSMRPPLEGLETREDTLVGIAQAVSRTAAAPSTVAATTEAAPTQSTPTSEAALTAPAPLRLTLGSGEEITASGLVIATGSTPRTLDVPGAAQWQRAGRLTTLHSTADALAIRALLADSPGARVLVSGAGLVGSEAATLLTEAGHPVTLVAPSTPPGEAALGRTLATRLAEIHSGAVDTRFGARLVRLEGIRSQTVSTRFGDDLARREDTTGDPHGLAVLDDGTEVRADLVIVAHGALPRVPQGVGGEAGIPVDDRLRVRGRPGILAAGAVALFTAGDGRTAHRIDHWDDAEAQGTHAARVFLHDLGLGADPGPYRPVSPWSARIHGRQLAGFGHRMPASHERIVSEDPLLIEFVDTDGALCAVLGLDAGRALRESARSLRE